MVPFAEVKQHDRVDKKGISHNRASHFPLILPFLRKLFVSSQNISEPIDFSSLRSVEMTYNDNGRQDPTDIYINS